MSHNGSQSLRQSLPTKPAVSDRPALAVGPAPQTPPPVPELPPVDWALPQDEPLAEVERQMERGSQFTQAALDKLVGRLAGAEAYITELVGLLKTRGILSEEDLADEDAAESAASEEPEALAAWEEPPEGAGAGSLGSTPAAGVAEPNDRAPLAEATVGSVAEAEATAGSMGGAGVATAETVAEAEPLVVGTVGDVEAPNEHGDAQLSPSGTQAKVSWPGIAFRVDPEDPEPPVEVNCAERMHVCHAVCCKLNFALTPEEVDAGTVKWDLGFPYMIRHGANGYCSHNDTATGRCTNYGNRPGVCHRYSCAHDSRIWKDFDAMVLNEDWIRANLTAQSRITVGKALPLMEVKHGDGSKDVVPRQGD